MSVTDVVVRTNTVMLEFYDFVMKELILKIQVDEISENSQNIYKIYHEFLTKFTPKYGETPLGKLYIKIFHQGPNHARPRCNIHPFSRALAYFSPADRSFDSVAADKRKTEKKNAIETIHEILRYINEHEDNQANIPFEIIDATDLKDSDIDSVDAGDNYEKAARKAVKKELKLLKTLKFKDPKQHRQYILDQWKILGSKMPHLRKVVLFLAAIGFTSASIEKAFSTTQYNFSHRMKNTEQGGLVNDMFIIRNR